MVEPSSSGDEPAIIVEVKDHMTHEEELEYLKETANFMVAEQTVSYL